MLWHIAWFEIRFWLRSWMLWIFLFVVGLLIFAAIGSDEVMAELNLSNIYRNAPFTIASFYAAMGVFALLMTAVFVNFAALRDFSYNTHQMMFSTPVRRRDFLLGRFLGATLVSAIPLLGVSLGILLAKHMPWADRERWEAVIWTAHLKGVLLFRLARHVFHRRHSVCSRGGVAQGHRALCCRDSSDGRPRCGPIVVAGPAVGSPSISARPFCRQRISRGHQILDGGRQEHSSSQLQWLTALEPSDLARSWVRGFCFRILPLQLRREADENLALEPDEQPAIAPTVTPAPYLQFTDSLWAKFMDRSESISAEWPRTPPFS